MAEMIFHHMAVVADDPLALERWYTKHFGFQRARVVELGNDQIVFIKRNDIYLEIFNATENSPCPIPHGAGPEYANWRHLAFKVDDVDAKLAEMGDEAKITLGPVSFNDFIPGWYTAWVADPAGNIVEITQGYVDQESPPPLEEG
jgi:glyoxylase I family protein